MIKLKKGICNILISSVLLLVFNNINSIAQFSKHSVKIDKEYKCSEESSTFDQLLRDFIEKDSTLKLQEHAGGIRVVQCLKENYNFANIEFYLLLKENDPNTTFNLMFVLFPYSEPDTVKNKHIDFFEERILSRCNCCD